MIIKLLIKTAYFRMQIQKPETLSSRVEDRENQANNIRPILRLDTVDTSQVAIEAMPRTSESIREPSHEPTKLRAIGSPGAVMMRVLVLHNKSDSDKDENSNKMSIMQKPNANVTSMGLTNNTSEQSVHNDVSHLVDIRKTSFSCESKDMPDVGNEAVNVIEGFSQRINRASHDIPQALPKGAILPGQVIHDGVTQHVIHSCAIRFKPVLSTSEMVTSPSDEQIKEDAEDTEYTV